MKNIKIIEKAQNFIINNENDMKEAVELLSTLNKMKDEITTEKEKVTRPLLDALNAERARWKPQETRLDSVISAIRLGITKFQTALVLKKKEEEEKIAKKLEDGKIKATTAIKKMESLDTVESRVETESGSITFKTVTRFEISNHTIIPREYILLNDTLVREALKGGKKIDGVTYYEEQVPVNKR